MAVASPEVVRVAHRSSERQQRDYPTLAEHFASLIAPPIDSSAASTLGEPTLIVPTIASGATIGARRAETASALADGTNQTFLGDIGDKYAVLEKAAGC